MDVNISWPWRVLSLHYKTPISEYDGHSPTTTNCVKYIISPWLIRDNVVVNDKLILHLYGSVLVVVVAYGCPSLQPHQIFMWNTTEKAFIPGGLCQNGTWTTSCWLSMSRGKNTWSRAETMASAIIFTHFLYVCVLAHNDWIHFASCCLSLVSSTFLIKDQ